MAKFIYDIVQRTGQLFAKTIRLRMDVFCSHIQPLPKENAAYPDLWYAHPYPPWQQHMHHRRFRPLRWVRLQPVVPCNARCGGSGFASINVTKTQSRQLHLKRQPVSVGDTNTFGSFSKAAGVVHSPGQTPAAPRSRCLDLRHAPVDEQLNAGDIAAVI
jgi:hypothetical protein